MYPGKWAEEFPDKPAVIHAGNDERVTFRELNDRSNQLAQLMWQKGLRPGDHIEFSEIGAYSLAGRTRFNGHYSDAVVHIEGLP